MTPPGAASQQKNAHPPGRMADLFCLVLGIVLLGTIGWFVVTDAAGWFVFGAIRYCLEMIREMFKALDSGMH